MSSVPAGSRVRSTNPNPTFASDPQPGDVGTVLESSESAGATSYHVRWEDGSETWTSGEHVEPVGRRPSAGPAGVPGPPGGMRPPRAGSRPGGPNLRRYLPLAFIVFASPGIVRGLANVVRHPSPASVVAALAGAALIALLVYRVRRRVGRPPRPR